MKIRGTRVRSFVVALAAVAVAATVTAAPALGDTEISNGQTYTVSQVPVSGTTANGFGTWSGTVGEISGGDPAVATAFNDASHASLQWQLDQFDGGPDTVDDVRWTHEVQAAVTFGNVTVSELLTGVFFAQHAAHPVNYVSTVVIDSRTARPITLADLFVDEQAGLNILSEQTVVQVGAQLQRDLSQDEGAKPVASNFDNWIPTPAGLEIHYEDYQFVHGLLQITVPWSALQPLLAPDIVALTQS